MTGWSLRDGPGGGIADEDLERGEDRGGHESQGEPGVVVPVTPAAQDARRVHPGDGEPGDHVGGQDHVRHLVDRSMVEKHLPRIDRHDPAMGDGEPAGLVHPRVDRDHRHGPEDATQRYRHPGPPVRPSAQPPPAVQVDRGEDGLEEEEQALDAEWQPEHRAVLAHQARPQQSHLERQHRAGDRADGNQHAHRLRPAPCQHHRHLVRPPQPDELGDQHDRRQRDPQAGQDNVEPQGGRHLRASGDHFPAHPRSGDHRCGS